MEDFWKLKKYNLILGIILILALTIIIYHRILNSYFVGEDYEWWTRVNDLNFLESFRLFLPPSLGGIVLFPYFRPLVGWTVWLNTVPFGMNQLTFHLTSLFFHLINTFLIGFLGYYIFKKDIKASFIAMILFITFPFHTEAVVWSVGGRYDLVMATFYLLALIVSIKYSFAKYNYWIYLTCFFYFLALLSKESAVTLPLSIICVLFIFNKISLTKTIFHYKRFLVLLCLVFLFYFFLRTIALHTINPYSLTPQLKFFFISHIAELFFGVCIIMVLVMIVLNKTKPKLFGKEKKTFLTLYVLIGVMYLPSMNIPTQERQLYLSSVGLILFVTYIGRMLYKWLDFNHYIVLNKIIICLFGVILLINGIVLFKKNENWHIAGNIAFSIAKQLSSKLSKTPNTEKVYVINIPDSFRGAYIYRTHFQEAIQFRSGRRKLPEIVLTPKISGLDSSASIMDRTSLRVKSIGSFVIFMPIFDELGRIVIKDNHYIATFISKEILDINFLDNDFDTRKSAIYVFRENKIELLNEN